MKRISIICAVLALALALPVGASAQLGPTNVPAPLTQPDDTSQDTTPFEQDTGLSTVQLVMMFGGAIAIIAFIAWFIMRDAHRAAPAAERGRAAQPAAAGPGAGGQRITAREREREKARKRGKTKAQRNQRKRNRPR